MANADSPRGKPRASSSSGEAPAAVLPGADPLPRAVPRAAGLRSVGGSMSSGSGLNAVLETAALMHASGQPEAARTVLEEAIATEPETAGMPLVWLALLDLYQQLNDKAAFERYGMEYAVRFEQSPPVWASRAVAEPADRSPFKAEAKNALVMLAGEISGANTGLSAPLLRVLDAPDRDSYQVNLARAELIDEGGAWQLAHVLAKVRKQQLNMVLEPWPELLVRALQKRGQALPGKQGEGYWQLWLELLQWSNDEALFETCALDFALRFEVSPPSWEPAHGRAPPLPQSGPAGVAAEGTAAAEAPPMAPNVMVWRGALHGAHAPQLAAFKERMPLYDELIVDLHEVTRIDFSYGGALANLVIRAESSKKQVRFIRTSPMVLSLLLLVGIPARAFSRR